MKYHIADKRDIFLRRAIWETYKRCLYCGIALEVRHMEIDHIMPQGEELIKKTTDPDLQCYIKELEEQKFEKNSIENYALCCSDCNKKKGNRPFSASNLRFFHEYVCRHALKVANKWEKYRFEIDSVSKMNSSGSERYPEVSDSSLSCAKSVSRFMDQSSFKYGLGEVRIDAFLPASYEGEMSCLILLKKAYQADMFITLCEKDIKQYLFSGYHTELEQKKRLWYNDYSPIGENVYEINLPNVKHYVSHTATIQMAKICDALYDEYILQDTIITDILGAGCFEKRDKGSYLLFAIRNDVLGVLRSYMKNHQYNCPETIREGKNIFHLYAHNDNKIDLQQNLYKEEGAGVYACINLNKVEGYHEVIWSPGFTGWETSKMSGFDNKRKWTALYTYKKFLTQIIPMALLESEYNLLSSFRYMLSGKKQHKYSIEYLVASGMIKSYKDN